MRTDVVLSLGEAIGFLDPRVGIEGFDIRIVREIRAVIRIVVDEELSPEERAEVVESFSGALALKSGTLRIQSRYVETRYEDEEECDQRNIAVPKGNYRLTLHATLAGPCVPAKVEKETLAKFFKRTRPGEALPSWVNSDEPSNDFWVGLILHLKSTSEEIPIPRRRQTIKTGKGVAKPEVCPPGIRSEKPLGWENYVQTDLHYTQKVQKLVSKLEPVPLKGGPVSIPVASLVLPYWIAWVCGETHPWVRVTCPASFSPEWPGFLNGIKETKTPNGWDVDVEGMNARWTPFGHLRQIGALLSDLPDGSTIEMDCAMDDGDGKKGKHRYLGTVRDGAWEIEQTYPAMEAPVLREMLELVKQGEDGLVLQAKNEGEAEFIQEAIDKREFLLRQTPPTRSGLVFQVSEKKPELMPFLVAWGFIARFPKVLPMIERGSDLSKWDAMLDRVAQVGAAWATGEVVLEGRFAKFTQASATPPSVDFDEWLLAHGFTFLGDLNSTQTFAAVFRGYGLPNEPIYAGIIRGSLGFPTFDLFTRFPDGFSLTTTHASDLKKPNFTTYEERKSYHHKIPGDFAAQWSAHLEKLGSLVEKHGTPAASGGLREFAEALDAAFCKLHGVKN